MGNWNKLYDLGQMPWQLAFAAAGGTHPEGLLGANAFYHELLLLASGIQMAGPHLTAESFAAALHATTFANPGAGTRPSYQATVGFPGNTATMVQDENEFWLDPRGVGQATADRNHNPWYAFCYVGLGTRISLASMPRADGFYGQDCR